MSRYLLDTNVISELRKPRPHGGVVAWFDALDAEDWFLPAIVVGELQAGIELTMKNDPAKAAELEAWLEELIAVVSLLPLDGPVCREWARLMSGKSRSLSEDGFIAATARVHDLVVATRNSRDFQDFGVQLYNPFLNVAN